jgi:predicted DNA binding CopG/RHH family protein
MRRRASILGRAVNPGLDAPLLPYRPVFSMGGLEMLHGRVFGITGRVGRDGLNQDVIRRLFGPKDVSSDVRGHASITGKPFPATVRRGSDFEYPRALALHDIHPMIRLLEKPRAKTTHADIAGVFRSEPFQDDAGVIQSVSASRIAPDVRKCRASPELADRFLVHFACAASGMLSEESPIIDHHILQDFGIRSVIGFRGDRYEIEASSISRDGESRETRAWGKKGNPPKSSYGSNADAFPIVTPAPAAIDSLAAWEGTQTKARSRTEIRKSNFGQRNQFWRGCRSYLKKQNRRYPEKPVRQGQFYFVLMIKDYTHLIPFIISGDKAIILKTVFPGRKLHRKYGDKKWKKIKLDAFEKDLEKNADKLVPVSDREAKNVYSLIERAKKNTSISLRINNYDLDNQREADISSLPYQTLIHS